MGSLLVQNGEVERHFLFFSQSLKEEAYLLYLNICGCAGLELVHAEPMSVLRLRVLVLPQRLLSQVPYVQEV